MSSHASLDAAAQERKARLAQLKSLKRKQPESDDNIAVPDSSEGASVTDVYLSGRNYDVSARGPKLGFESDPSQNEDTAEKRARELSDQAKIVATREAQDDNKPLDLLKLQPRKLNWDLKRDLDSRMGRLNVRTENAIARLVRDRIQAQRKGDEADGLVGEEIITSVHVKEQQERDEDTTEEESEEFT